MTKIKVAVLFGGRSTEHEISLLSAQNIIRSLDNSKYEPVLIGIDKSGKWHYEADSLPLLNHTDAERIALESMSTEVYFSQNTDDHCIIDASCDNKQPLASIDVIFPVLHGTFGEDGAIQGLAKLANLPCVGPGILGSAVGMDKEVMKRLLRDGNILSAPWITLRRRDLITFDANVITDQLGTDVFVKPVNLGSSVGISHVTSKDELWPAIRKAFEFDNKVIIEKRIHGREIECAVLGNDEPMASIPGEVVPKDGFYSYEAKYLDANGAALLIPAELTDDEITRIQKLSIDTFTLLECEGMARIDMFLTPQGELYINEINTLPGFTNISMYPSLWKESGISNIELVDRLIELAFEAHRRDNNLRREM